MIEHPRRWLCGHPVPRVRSRDGRGAWGSVLRALADGSAALLELLERARPVGLHQARESPVGQELPLRLAARAVVRFILRIDDSLDGSAAVRAGLAEPAVDGHPV